MIPIDKEHISKGDITLVLKLMYDYTFECKELSLLKQLLEEGYNAFLAYPVTDWETFSELKKLGVSDIYIDGPLGFQAEAIAKEKGDIQIRVSPTMSPNASLTGPSPQSFFIRPEDLNLYEGVIDIIDFKELESIDREEALFTIFKRGTFNYNLSQLVTGMNPDVNNLMFPQEFGKERLNCGQRCKIHPGRCHYCDTTFKLINSSIQWIESRKKE